jgi:NAD-dependent SIR2 family protein deacetylase
MSRALVPPELLDRFRSGGYVLFVGSGVSTESGLPSGRQFKDMLIDKTGYPRREVTLSKVAQAFEDFIDRPSLIGLIIEQFGHKVQSPGQSHKLIAQLAKQGYIAHIVTTNYDTLLEDVLTLCGCEFHLSKRDIDVSSAGSKIHLVKLHGSVNDIETIVITEADYRNFFRKRPVLRNLLGGLLVEKTFIFLGYGLEDPDFDQIYHDITSAMGDFQRLSYAVQQKPDDFSDEQWNKFHVDPWTRRKIRIITASAEEFLTELQTKLQAPPTTIPREEKHQQQSVWEFTKESPLGEAGQVRIVALDTHPLLNCTVEIEFRMDDDGGDPSQWFGIRVRGVTSYFSAGYLIYLRSNGYLDVFGIEERSILSGEVQAVNPKDNFVKLKVSIIEDQLMVWVNEKQLVNERNRLVTWPGRVYLHTFGTKVTTRLVRLFEVRTLPT